MTHTVEIETKYLNRILNDEKMFEVRLNDRDYQAGDILHFEEVREDTLCRNCSTRKKITYIHSGLGMKDGYVVLGLTENK